jgi:hypothetical protein
MRASSSPRMSMPPCVAAGKESSALAMPVSCMAAVNAAPSAPVSTRLPSVRRGSGTARRSARGTGTTELPPREESPEGVAMGTRDGRAAGMLDRGQRR